ncbi:MAG: nucleotidyltransferase family protein [Desulfuromonadales bacterium]|nr:nucleotidyltransferase family protein [Desulfuromonadales bacterium]
MLSEPRTAVADHPEAVELPRRFRRNPYALSALLLAPHLSAETTAALRQAIGLDRIDWGEILTLVNLHFCTPLLYVRLRQHRLLSHLPPELREFLHCLHEANCERNDAFRNALRCILQVADGLGISCLLLKGAASLADDLYRDPGARMLGDLDLLVEPPGTERLWRELVGQWGYVTATEAPAGDFPVSPDYRRHHLPRLFLPGTPVVIEIHHRPSRGQAGRGLPASLFWAGKVPIDFVGQSTFIPDPTSRLLHATFHALLPMREFIQSSLPLAALAEFSALGVRYSSEIQHHRWLAVGTETGADHEFQVFRQLARQLMGGGEGDADWRSRLAIARIVAGGNAPALSDTRFRQGEKVKSVLIRAFYLSHLPGWLWRNPCYGRGWTALPRRFYYLRQWWGARNRAARLMKFAKNDFVPEE